MEKEIWIENAFIVAAQRRIHTIISQEFDDLMAALDKGEEVNRKAAHAYVSGMYDLINIENSDPTRRMWHSEINRLFDFYECKQQQHGKGNSLQRMDKSQ